MVRRRLCPARYVLKQVADRRLAVEGPRYDPIARARHLVLKHVLVSWCLLGALATAAGQELDRDGFRVHCLSSPYQAGETRVRVLLPDRFDAQQRHRVLYVLPVVAGSDRRFGDGLAQARRLNVHNQFQLICVSPEFTAPPWYADHAHDETKREESHLLKVVLPYVDATYPTRPERKGRLLVGFSKSAWGAFSLLMRHPRTFDRAAGWDPGIRIDTGPMPDADRQARIAEIFGNRKTFEDYRLTALVRTRGQQLGPEPRLFYYNNAGKRAAGGAQLHALMLQHDVAHRYVYETGRRHRWDSGWLPAAMQFLVAPPASQKTP